MDRLNAQAANDCAPLYERVTVIVLDSVGCGALSDADQYGDVGANTLKHLSEAVGGVSLPNLERLGLGCVADVQGVQCVDNPMALSAKLALQSPGKDTTTGHWEMMGLPLLHPFPTYPRGFPKDLMMRFTEVTGYDYLGNYPASGTEIINNLGPEHLKTKKLIVYTSADSVFQIAAHEDVVELSELYRICELVRTELLVGQHAVGRVIARPFTGTVESGFERTSGRHDYSLAPHSRTVLDELQSKDVCTVGIGKICDIFCGQGISESFPTANNAEGMAEIERHLRLSTSRANPSFIFANLVDFDMKWGHRRDCDGYANGLEEFDAWLGTVIPLLTDQDYFIITADHGCDPAHSGSDHTREYVPFLGYAPLMQGAVLDTQSSLSFVGKQVLSGFGLLEKDE